MNKFIVYVLAFSLFAAVTLALTWVAFEQSPLITTASMIIGFPGFVFGMMVFPGVHADRLMIVSVMIVVNTIFYFLMISLLVKFYRYRVARLQNSPREGRNQ